MIVQAHAPLNEVQIWVRPEDRQIAGGSSVYFRSVPMRSRQGVTTSCAAAGMGLRDWRRVHQRSDDRRRRVTFLSCQDLRFQTNQSSP